MTIEDIIREIVRDELSQMNIPIKSKLKTKEILRHHGQKAGESDVRMFEKFAGLLADYSEDEIIRICKIPVNAKGKRSILRLAVKLGADVHKLHNTQPPASAEPNE